jgi:diguanylate cyclase (GGDEF)-like protein
MTKRQQYILIPAIIVVVLSVIFVTVVNNTYFSQIVYVNNSYMHTSLEAIGATVLIIMAFLFLVNQELIFFNVRGIIYGYLFMGVFSVYHSMIDAGDGFVFFFVLSMLFGGLGFLFTIVHNLRQSTEQVSFLEGALALIVAVLIALLLLELNQYPNMVHAEGFTSSANMISIVTGTLYFISILFMYGYYKKQPNTTLRFFILSNALLMISSFTFPFSSTWSLTWWIWHYIRLASFFVVFVTIIYLAEQNKRSIMKKSTEIEFISFHDELTGLYNRRFFDEELKRYDNPRSYPITIVMADLNGLKLVNDAFGHLAGDEYLQLAGQLFSEESRSTDVVARWGGDEFAIIMPNSDQTAAKALINRMQERIQDTSFEFGEISIAFGYDTKNSLDIDITTTFQHAEEMMYYDKNEIIGSVRSATINTILETLFQKSKEIKKHSERVSIIASEIAKKMNLPMTKINDIKTMGRLHDIGKIIIDSSILEKTTNLTEKEWNIIKQHPLTGSKMLAMTQEYTRLSPGVLHHHEQFDGNGYPNGIKGSEIPIESRIIAVADAYDAMISERPYKKTCLTKEEARIELLRCAGSQFDPKVISVFVNKVLPSME